MTVQLVRVFNAPRERVFAWWTTAERVQQWSGCDEAVQCSVEMDFRVGGSFTQRMQIAGKGEFAIAGVYDDIVVPERIVYSARIGQAVTRVSIEFFDEGGQTKVVLTHDGLSDEISRTHVARGTGESLDALGAILNAAPVEAR